MSKSIVTSYYTILLINGSNSFDNICVKIGVTVPMELKAVNTLKKRIGTISSSFNDKAYENVCLG